MKIEFISTDSVIPNPKQPREAFDKEKIKELANSINEHDLLHPIIVKKKGKNYQILAGERRWRAYDFAKINKIPAIIKDVTELEGREISIIENWHRLKLEPLESEQYIAELYADGLKDGRYTTVADMSRKTGLPKPSLQRFISSHRDRIEQKINHVISYGDIDRTSTLREEPETRRKVLDLRSKDKIKATDLPIFSETIKKATEPVKQALLKEEPSITPELAEEIMQIEHEEEQQKIIESLETKKLSGSNAKEFVTAIKRATKPIKEALLKPKSRITPEIAHEIMSLDTEEEQKATIEEVETYRLTEEETKKIIERHKETIKMEQQKPEITSEELATIQAEYTKFENELAEKLSTPEAKQRGALFQSWLAHGSLRATLQHAFCPHCGEEHSGKLIWNCCGLTAEESCDLVGEKYQEAIDKDIAAKPKRERKKIKI